MSSSQDVRYSAEKVRQGQALANKLFNAARFVLLRVAGMGNPTLPVELAALASAPRPRTIEDRWILSRLQEAVADTAARIEDYDFSHAALGLYDFVYGELCDWYLELVKPRLAAEPPHGTAEEREALAATLLYVLRETVALAHPVLPFVTEELWSHLDSSGALLAGSPYPRADAALSDRDVEVEMGRVIEAVTLVRGWRDAMSAPPGAVLPARLRADGYEHTAALVAHLARLDLSPSEAEPVASVAVPCGTVEVLSAAGLDFEGAARRRAAAAGRLEAEIARVQGKLGSAAFVERAPAEVVEGERARLARLQAELEAL